MRTEAATQVETALPRRTVRVKLVDDHEVVRKGVRSLLASVPGLAEKTIKNHGSTILSKLEGARRAEAAAYVTRHSLVG